MIEINGGCDNAKEKLCLREYVRRDFALDRHEELLLLVFFFPPPSYRIIYASSSPLSCHHFIALKILRDVYDITFCFAASIRYRLAHSLLA